MDWELIDKVIISSTFNWVWCGLTVLYGAWWLGRLWWQRRRLYTDLRSALRAASGINRPEAFCEKFRMLDEAIEKLPSLQHAWAEFKETLLYPEPDSEKVIRNTRPPKEFFSQEEIVESQIPLRFYGTVPNHLTGFGILGTFVGLAAGIALSQKGLTGGGGIEGMQKALGQLLGGAALAFLTSIAGLVSAVTFLITERIIVGRLLARLGQWVQFLDRSLELVTPENIAAQQLRELKAQTRQLEFFSNDFAAAVAEALDNKLNARLSPHFQKIGLAVEQIRDRGLQASEEVLQDVVSQLGTVVSGATSKEVAALGGMLQEVTASLSSTVQALNASKSAIASVLESEVDVIRGRLEGFSRSLDENLLATSERVSQSLEDAGRAGSASLTAASQQLANTAEALQTFFATAGDARQQLDEATARLGSAVQALGLASSGFATVAAPIREAVQAFTQTGSQILASGAQFDAASKELTRTAELIRVTSATMQSAWGEHRERFEQIDEMLGNMTTKLQDFVDNFVEKAGSFVREMDVKMATAVQTLAGAVTELEGTLEDMRPARQ